MNILLRTVIPLCLLAAALPANSEKAIKSPFPSWGLKGGIQKASLGQVGSNQTEEGLTSVRMGLYMDLPLGSGPFLIQPELHLMGRGCRMHPEGTSEEVRNQYSFAALQVPVLLTWTLGLRQGRRLTPYLSTGPALGIKLSAWVLRDVDQNSDGQYEKLEDARSLSLGWVLGTGLAFPMGRKGRGLLEIRADFGLTSVFTSTQRRHRSLSFLIGYQG